jgi:hypothetical protein
MVLSLSCCLRLRCVHRPGLWHPGTERLMLRLFEWRSVCASVPCLHCSMVGNSSSSSILVICSADRRWLFRYRWFRRERRSHLGILSQPGILGRHHRANSRGRYSGCHWFNVFGPVPRTRSLWNPGNPAVSDSLFESVNGVPKGLIELFA